MVGPFAKIFVACFQVGPVQLVAFVQLLQLGVALSMMSWGGPEGTTNAVAVVSSVGLEVKKRWHYWDAPFPSVDLQKS